jgi:hypothetical protein
VPYITPYITHISDTYNTLNLQHLKYQKPTLRTKNDRSCISTHCRAETVGAYLLLVALLLLLQVECLPLVLQGARLTRVRCVGARSVVVVVVGGGGSGASQLALHSLQVWKKRCCYCLSVLEGCVAVIRACRFSVGGFGGVVSQLAVNPWEVWEGNSTTAVC